MKHLKRRRYDEEIQTKPIVERIIETVNLLINQRFKTERKITLNLKTLREVVPKVMEAPRIVQYHENMLKTALMKDLFKEVKEQRGDISQILPELKSFAEEFTKNYILKAIERDIK